MSQQSSSFNRWLVALGKVASARRWRYLVVLSGDRQWSLDLCRSSGLLCAEGSLWVCDPPAPQQWSIAPGQARSLLGAETDHLVYDAWSGLHPNGFGALAGTLRAGGLLVLLAPPLSQWGHYRDPDFQRMAVPGFEPRRQSYFLEHLARIVAQQSQALLLSEGSALPELPAMPAAAVVAEMLPDGVCFSRDQADAVAAIEHVLGGHRDRPLVLTADRGRGKTAALGIAAARLLSHKVDYILVTAPLFKSVETLFKHAQTLLAGSEQHRHTLLWQGRRIEYLPPDELLSRAPAARLLLVDEAAAIPAPLLGAMLDHYHRVVFTTTVHGYEGTGRGFAIRFQRELDRRRPNWQLQTLVQPVRWALDDPLEQAVSRMLWLDAEAAADEQVQQVGLETVSIDLIERHGLLQQPALLRSLVGLLTSAHYRTTPDDIRLILDAPNMSLVLARQGDVLVGAVLLAREGELDATLSEAIVQGVRRPRGHLLPQTLWAQTGCEDLLGVSGWRVVRIAVHPAIQRCGLGLRMLQRTRQLATAQGMAYLGSSFAASEELVAFWCSDGYIPVAIGVRRDAASGAHSLLLLQGLNVATSRLVMREQQRFARVLPHMLLQSLRSLECGVVVALLDGLASHYELAPRDALDVQAFARGARSYEHCTLALHSAALVLLSDRQRRRRLDAQQCNVLVARVLQQCSWSQTARLYGLSGKAQVVQCLRDALVA